MSDNARIMAPSDDIEVRTRNGPLLPAEEQRRRWRRLAELLLSAQEEPSTLPTKLSGGLDDKEPLDDQLPTREV